MSKVSNRILIVDDDPDIGLMIKTMLEYQGYAATVTDRADRVQKMVGEGNFDLVIMDMLLSGVNGTDICSELKKDPAAAPYPVIMISAHPNARQVCLDAGADDFISKPFDMSEMLGKIKGFLAPN